MVQSVHDPATNASLAASAHARYAGSVLITVTNEGDHGIFGGVNPCVDRIVSRYLGTGVAPRVDRTCVGTGIPAPAAMSSHPAASAPLERIAALTDRIEATLAG